MPVVVFHKAGERFEGTVAANTNLVVRAGIRKYPFPHLTYGCGMGKCARCACRVLSGAEHLPEPNWKELKMLGDRIGQGYRLMCQLWINEDIEVQQEVAVVAAKAAG